MLRPFLAIAMAAVAVAAPMTAHADPNPAPPVGARPLDCAVPVALSRLDRPLTRTARVLAAGGPLTIVAVGSSSTAGAGASKPENCYPSRLEAELRERFPGVPVKVLNRGVNGEEAIQMLARFDLTVLADKPDLVIWQVGSNAVLRGISLATQKPLIDEGVRRLQAAGADVILMDPQYAPKVLERPDADGMVQLLGAIGAAHNVSVFHRFAIMRHWRDVSRISYAEMLSPDGVHMNDWSYGCLAKLLSASIAHAGRGKVVARIPTPTR